MLTWKFGASGQEGAVRFGFRKNLVECTNENWWYHTAVGLDEKHEYNNCKIWDSWQNLTCHIPVVSSISFIMWPFFIR